MKLRNTPIFILLLASIISQQAVAAIALDRTRVIVNGNEKSVSLSISNHNKQLPYLAQGWIEDELGNKITTPLTILPPIQRVEPGAESQIKVVAMPGVEQLSQEVETLFYFNIREIPPRSDKPNTLQIALQTRVKLFYRPKNIMPTKADMATPWQEKITLTRQGDSYLVANPTPYFITLVDAASHVKGKSANDFTPIMIAPKSTTSLGISAAALGKSPVLTYINDYGGRPKLIFNCNSENCEGSPVKS
jgi:chaperone protein PapD